MLKAGERCHRCSQIIPKSVIEAKRKARAENARRSAAKAKANGTHYGRPKKRNDSEIWRLRALGFTMREIASTTGVSTTAVQRSLKMLIPRGNAK